MKPAQKPQLDTIEPESRTKRKQHSEDMQDLGEALIELSIERLRKIQLPEHLYEAIREAKRLTANGAIRRQKQFIGKIMREIDPAPIQAKLDILQGNSGAQTAYLHQVERWRDRLIQEDMALAELIDDYPAIDVQAIRQMIRNARQEQAQQKPAKFYREIFQFLKETIPAPHQLIDSYTDEDEDEQDAID